MGFSTFRATVDRCLRRTGQAIWVGDTEFNANNGEEIQVQAKDIVDEVNRRFLRLSRGRFLRREGTITTNSSVNKYDGVADANAERYKEGSWRITAPAASAFGPITYKDFIEWTTENPNGEAKGTPREWFLYTRTSTDKDEIGFSPPPDGVYTIKYDYYLGPQVLSQASDTLLWPNNVEDLLWTAARYEIEAVLAEGKSMEIAGRIDELFSEVAKLTREPTDAPSVVDLGLEISPFGGFRHADW